MASPFDFPNLAPYQQVAAQQMLEQGRRVPLQEMIASYNQGLALQQAPRLAAQKQAADALALQIQQANLQRLQRPQVFNTGQGLAVEDPNTGGFSIVPGTSPVGRSSPFQMVGIAPGAEGQPPQGTIVFNPATGNSELRPLPTGVTQIDPKVTQPPKGTRGGLTANAVQTYLGKAAFEKVDLSDPKWRNEDGTYKVEEINLETRVKEREREDAEKQLKLNAASGLQAKERGELSAVYLAQKQLAGFKDAISNIQKTSGEPGVIQNMLSVVAAQPSTGLFSSLSRQSANLLMSEDSKIKEDLRSTISSAVQSAISGKVITKLEATQLGFIPQGDDTIDRLISKGQGLEEYLNNKEASIFESTGREAPGTPRPASPSTRPAGPRIIKITPRASP